MKTNSMPPLSKKTNTGVATAKLIILTATFVSARCKAAHKAFVLTEAVVKNV